MRCRTALRYLRTLAAPLVLATALTGLAPTDASAAVCHFNGAKQPRSPGAGGTDLNGVVVLSPCNAWAVGSFLNGPDLTLAEHWDGSAWQVMPSANPSAEENFLLGVGAVSAHDIWAVGSAGRSGGRHALIERSAGSAWTQVHAPAPGTFSELESVRPVSASDAWAAGFYVVKGRDKTLILRWNGSVWKQVPSPSPAPTNFLAGLAATSSRDVWAVGEAADSNGLNTSGLILHWNGHRWQRAAIPHPGHDSLLRGVATTSAASAWAVGSYESGGTIRPLLLHWNGTRWNQAAGPRGISGALNGVSVISARNAWAAGSVSGAKGDKALLLHWDGSRWTRVNRHVPGVTSALLAVAASSATNIWAVGDFASSTVAVHHALGIHCC